MKLTQRGARVFTLCAIVAAAASAYWLARAIYWLLTVNLWGGVIL